MGNAYFLLPSFSDDVFLRLLRFALSLALSRGERGQIAENPIIVDFQHHYSLSVEEGQIAENLIMVGFSTIIPSPWKREQIAENPIIVDFQHHYSLSPWERVRERAKPQDTPYRFFC